MAAITSAFPLSPAATYGGDVTATTWDQDRIYGCLCDSSWAVGLAAGQSQLSQWFGADCSRSKCSFARDPSASLQYLTDSMCMAVAVRCPSGDDPMTSVDETDCSGVIAEGGVGTGATGNLCHVDCANRGICDFSSGACACFDGFYGSNCASLSPVN
ncbi:hypothetical protein BBJ28_00003445 [Nothophytophthora sp. Chile5]|nr:hypothetical protein BBJ28_00003445 [Nothophytophthora sp. Chile5]